MRRAIAGLGLALSLVSLVLLTAPARLHHVVTTEVDGVSLRYVVPRDTENAPVVLVAHGYAGTANMMRGYANSLASAGYAVATWDFAGHGASRETLGARENQLGQYIATVVQFVRGRAEVDQSRMAILGHSMGSGAAMRAGIEMHETFAAVIALSPTDAPVSPELPRNLQLQAGAFEPRFEQNARELLEEAGGAREGANARELVIIPGVEHISIVYSHASHTQAVAWLNTVFGRDAQPVQRDRRAFWYGLHLIGWVVIAIATRPWVRRAISPEAARGGGDLPAVRNARWPLRLVAAGAVAAGVIIGVDWLMNALLATRLAGIDRLSIVPAVSAWFLTFGIVWLALGFRPAAPKLRSLLLGLAFFGVLWLVVGLPGSIVAWRWALVPARAARWVPTAIASLPWLLAAGYGLGATDGWSRVGWFATLALTVVGALALVGFLTPGLFFLVLIVPIIPVVLGAMTLLGAGLRDPWAFGVGGALFLGWLLVAVFPLAA
ncbi:MAG: alpha/beta fold hydrolase [Spirochaetales bacterium]